MCHESEMGKSTEHSRNKNKAGEWEHGLEKVRLRAKRGSRHAGLLGRDLELNLRAMETLLICSEFYSIKRTTILLLFIFCCSTWAFPNRCEWGLLFTIASHCGGISFRGAQALGIGALVVAALGLSSCCTQVLVAHGMWNLPIPGTEPMSPALAGGFLTTVLPGKSRFAIFHSFFF